MIDSVITFFAALDSLFLILLGLFWTISFVCLFYLWRRPDSLVKKIVWSFILFIPFFGPVFYGGLYKPPPPHPDGLRATNTIWRLGGPGGHR